MKTKNLIKIFLFVAIATVFSCSSSDDSGDGDGGGNQGGTSSIIVTASSLYVDFGSEVTFTVKTGQGTTVTPEATLLVNGSPISGNTYTASSTGNYDVTATYESLTSSAITVNVLPVLVSISIETTAATFNLGDRIEYSVIGTDNDGGTTTVTSASAVFINSAESATGNVFIAGATGTLDAYATFNDLTSTPITVTIEDNASTPVAFDKKAVIEDFTGTWCGWCPRVSYGIELVEDATDKAVVIAVHSGDPMSTSYTSQLENAYNIQGYPTAMLNRSIEWTYPEPSNVAQVTTLASGTANSGVAINSAIKGNNLSFVVSSGFGQNVSGAKLVVLLLENGLTYDQTNYTDYYGGASQLDNFEHNHVLRHAFTNVLGDAIPAGETVANNTYYVKYDYTIPSSFNNSKMEIVALVVGANNQLINAVSVNAGSYSAF